MDNKSILITGATKGIGREIACTFAQMGYFVAINYRREEDALSLEKEIETLGGKALKVKGDVSNFEDAKNIMDKVLENFGTLDVLVNNAGITKDNLTIRMTPEEFHSVLDVNLAGTFYFMKLAARQMMKQRSGRIINISSIVGLHGNPGQINYAASKAGVIGMTKTLAAEIGSRNVTVNAVAPGFIQTAMTEKLTERTKEEYIKKIPLGRFGEPKDIANCIKFLASEEASYITGQIISVDGGMNL
ncbi:MAG: 3-oxoacyl-[acyl-carrier-protein] reductase [Tissierellia bacterium]|nr:3-oxoacyl-[acyl-carrier-protein] reductase [Tissierellia bacterium]